MSSLMSRWWRGALAAAIPAALALAGPFVVRVDAGGPTGPSARVYLEKAGEAPVSTAYAVSLKADPALFAGRTAHDHAIVIDTSASQVGEHRAHSLAVLKELLAALPADDRVCLYAADVKVAKLTDGYVAPSEVAAALKKLSMRAPLGATDLAATLKEVAGGVEASNRDASIVYIGDGMSAAGVISSDPLKTLCAELRDRKIPVHSYAVGPRLDLQLLGILAQQTGGLVLVDRAHEIKNDPGVAAHRLATAIDAPIVFPEQVKTEPKVALLPEQPLPIRGDRETIYLGRGEFPKSLQVTATGKQTMNWTATATAADAGHPFLAPHYRQAESTDGISVSFAGNDMLMAARQGFDDQVADLVSKGEQAVGQRQLKQAQAIGDAILQIDPENVKAKAILGAAEKAAARQARGNRQLAQAQPAPPAPPAPGNNSLLNDPSLAPATPPVPEDLIEQEKVRRRVRGEQLNLSVDSAINEARRIAPSDPDAALNLIKNNLNTVQVSDDVDPDLRRKLAQRLSIVHAETTAQRERANVLRVRAAERLSQLEAQQRLVEQAVRDDERLEQLIDRVRTLLIEGDHGHDDAFEQAEAVARIAVDLRPDSGTAAAAVFVSEAAGQLRKAFRLRALRADKFLEVLYQVELSHVPFPDEPPILWPPAEVWKALTERRKKWASVDLHRNSPAEERIQSALRDETEIQFVDTPLKEAMDFLSDLHQITIIVDETALMEEGIATDEPITRELSGITLRSAMKIILEPLGLTYIIKDEVMKITTQVKADEIMSTRVYPVGDLVIPIITPLAGGIGQGLGGVGGFGGSGGLGGFGGQFGLGGAGYGGGGGGIGGGLGGGGFYSVPVEEIPQSELNAFLGQDAPAFDNEAVKAAKKKLGPAR